MEALCSRQKVLGEFFNLQISNSFHVSTVHCQPVKHPEIDGQMRVLVVVYGTVKFEVRP